MGRFTRVVAVDVPHHVTQRGNGRRFILDCDADRAVYLSLLRENIDLYGVALIGYCLMSNHVHLMGEPGDGQGEPGDGNPGTDRTIPLLDLNGSGRTSRSSFPGEREILSGRQYQRAGRSFGTNEVTTNGNCGARAKAGRMSSTKDK